MPYASLVALVVRLAGIFFGALAVDIVAGAPTPVLEGVVRVGRACQVARRRGVPVQLRRVKRGWVVLARVGARVGE